MIFIYIKIGFKFKPYIFIFNVWEKNALRKIYAALCFGLWKGLTELTLVERIIIWFKYFVWFGISADPSELVILNTCFVQSATITAASGN